MLIIPPRPFVRRRLRPARKTPPPGVALTLLEASFDEVSAIVRLTFDRAIDIAGLNGAAIIVDDGATTATRYDATGSATLETPERVAIELQAIEPSESPGTLLTAGASSGIAAVDDGGTWAGVSDLALPYP